MLPDADLAKAEFKSVFNPSGSKLVCGERLLPSKVVRITDANQVRLQQEVKMNGAFRIHVMAGDLPKTKANLAAFAKHLDSPASFLQRFRPALDVRASIIDGYRPAASLPQPPQGSREVNPCVRCLRPVSAAA
jgi:hypothetical protein